MFALYDNEKQFNLYVESVAEEVRKEVVAKGFTEEFAERYAEGYAEGFAKGKKEEKIAIAKRLLDMGVLSVEQIAACTESPIKDIEALASA